MVAKFCLTRAKSLKIKFIFVRCVVRLQNLDDFATFLLLFLLSF